MPAVGDAPGILERLRVAEREARPLDEGAGDVLREHDVFVLEVQARERTQRAVLGLRAGVDLHVRAVPGRVLADRAVLSALRAGISRRAGARDVPAVVGADIATKLDA